MIEIKNMNEDYKGVLHMTTKKKLSTHESSKKRNV